MHNHETKSTRILQKNVRKTEKKHFKQANVTRKLKNESKLQNLFESNA